MVTIEPVNGYLVNPRRAAAVVSPAYDAMTPEQRNAYAEAHPDSYLNVMRSREEFPQAARPSLEELLRRNGARLRQMIECGDMQRQPKPCLYLYRLAVAGHSQTGVVAECPLSEYERGLIKRHEHTQAEKEDELTAYQRVVRASSSPICLAYEAQPRIDRLIGRLKAADPAIDFTAEDGVAQSVWRIDADEDIAELRRLFSGVPASYLTDGHHRAASALRVLESQRAENPAHTGNEPYNYLLVAFFPDKELRILEYNRRVKGMNAASVEALLAEIETSFEVQKLSLARAEEARPRRRGEMAMFVRGVWYRLRVRPAMVPADPVTSLDVSLLQDRLIAPVLGIDDPRTDPRMQYLSGAFALEELAALCAREDEIGFAVFPTSIEELMAVADRGEVMPPKSTWFDPKLRSGLFLRLR